MKEILLIHPGTKETKLVPVEDITRIYVAIRWGMSGIYDLNLRDNVLTARSIKARRKGMCLWQAVDIKAVREQVKIVLDKQDIKEVVATQRKEHDASMPHARTFIYARRKPQ